MRSRSRGLVVLFAFGLAPTAGCATVRREQVAPPVDGVEVVVLGTAQDGGLPHVGCRRAPCERARREPGFARRVVSLGLLDYRTGRRFLVEATPDLPAQLDLLEGVLPARPSSAEAPRPNPVDGVLITHAHVGHYAGLIHFGREVASTERLPLYGTPRLLDFLRHSGPWQLLFELEQVEARPLVEDQPTQLSHALRVTALSVPHRDEYSDTVALRFQGPRRSLLFVPDIDRWATWQRRIEDEVAAVDVALVDGTFYSAGELPGRAESEVPHPLVVDTLSRLAPLAQKVIFIHLNHTNPLVDPASPVSRIVERAGFRVATEGMRLSL